MHVWNLFCNFQKLVVCYFEFSVLRVDVNQFVFHHKTHHLFLGLRPYPQKVVRPPKPTPTIFSGGGWSPRVLWPTPYIWPTCSTSNFCPRDLELGKDYRNFWKTALALNADDLRSDLLGGYEAWRKAEMRQSEVECIILTVLSLATGGIGQCLEQKPEMFQPWPERTPGSVERSRESSEALAWPPGGVREVGRRRDTLDFA